MTEINKIDLLKIDARLQARKKSSQQTQDSNTKFEDQLLQTVKKLENMGSEIDAMMQNSAVQTVPKTSIELTVQKKGVGNLDNVVENFSAAGKTSVKSAKSIAAEYESMNRKKQS
jgi:hypothetical protein